MSPRKLVLGVAVAGAFIAAGLGAAWAIDDARGLELAGLDVGDHPDATIDRVADDFGDTAIVLHTTKGDIRTSAAELGVHVDRRATLRSIADAEDAGPGAWLRGLFERRAAPLVVDVDDTRAAAFIREKDPTGRTDPVEPAVVGDRDGIGVRKGKRGKGLDADALATQIEEAARHAAGTIEVDVEAVPLSPRHTLAEAETLAARARRLTADELDVVAGDASATIEPRMLRSWIRSTDELTLDLDDDAVLEHLAEVLAAAEEPAVDATISIEGGRPVIVRGRNGTECCAPEAVDEVLAAILDRPAVDLSVPLLTVEPAWTSAELEALKIAEQIGTFTTRFQSGQSRVTNIHRIADIVDGTIIEPGKRLSINGLVGERTKEKGFVLGGVIQDGTFTESVGGGVSQFATTFFNAAFFGGLDIPAYQSHSIYISRYPYGREATLSWPKPDLVVANSTPYGVFVDTSYSSTSVTVTLWSTRYATGEQTNQTTSPVGNCTRVKTERTRTYVDGRTQVDNVFATYRPEEGVRC